MENVFLCSPTKMDRGEGGGMGSFDQSKDRNGEILIENSFSTVRVCKIVRGSERDPSFVLSWVLGYWWIRMGPGVGGGVSFLGPCSKGKRCRD